MIIWDIGIVEDIDIFFNEFKGSIVDKSYLFLLINGVIFDDKSDYIFYWCLVRNLEGWGVSDNVNIIVIGSMFVL